jgi:hypothetical protein
MRETNSPLYRCLRRALAALALAIAGCPTPAQEGGLARIDTEGFARRLAMVCSSGHADPSCPPPLDASNDDEQPVDGAYAAIERGDGGAGRER